MKTKLLRHIETVTIVTLISVLVWMYAEGETVQQFEGTLRIELAAPPDEELAIAPGGTQVVRVVYRCATSQLPRFNQATTTPIAIRLNPNQRALNLREALRERFAPMAIDIIDARDEENADTIAVRAEPIRRLDMRIEADTSGVEGVAIEVIDIEPEEVSVAMPESLVQVARGLNLQVRLADLAASPNPTATAGTVAPLGVGRHVRSLSIRLPEPLARPEHRPHVRPAQSTAEVTFEVRPQATFQLPHALPITVRVAPEVIGRAEVLIDGRERGTVGRVTLKGPGAAIADIREGRIELAAVVDLTEPEHFAAIDQQRQLELPLTIQGLPPGVTVQEPDPLPKVTVTIRPRNASP